MASLFTGLFRPAALTVPPLPDRIGIPAEITDASARALLSELNLFLHQGDVIAPFLKLLERSPTRSLAIAARTLTHALIDSSLEPIPYFVNASIELAISLSQRDPDGPLALQLFHSLADFSALHKLEYLEMYIHLHLSELYGQQDQAALALAHLQIGRASFEQFFPDSIRRDLLTAKSSHLHFKNGNTEHAQEIAAPLLERIKNTAPAARDHEIQLLNEELRHLQPENNCSERTGCIPLFLDFAKPLRMLDEHSLAQRFIWLASQKSLDGKWGESKGFLLSAVILESGSERGDVRPLADAFLHLCFCGTELEQWLEVSVYSDACIRLLKNKDPETYRDKLVTAYRFKLQALQEGNECWNGGDVMDASKLWAAKEHIKECLRLLSAGEEDPPDDGEEFAL
jgi:hypothetical protein